jgi:Ca2+-binding EF-hand superfamily protein
MGKIATVLATLVIIGSAALAAEGGEGRHPGPQGPKPRERMKRFMEKRPDACERIRERFDSDGDGKLCEGERVKARETIRARGGEIHGKLLEKFDTDGDGKLSDEERDKAREEFKARLEEIRDKLIEKFDADGDGKLSDGERDRAREERKARFGELRTEIKGKSDSDGDGKLNGEERIKARNMFKDKMGGRFDKGEGQGRRMDF